MSACVCVEGGCAGVDISQGSYASSVKQIKHQQIGCHMLAVLPSLQPRAAPAGAEPRGCQVGAVRGGTHSPVGCKGRGPWSAGVPAGAQGGGAGGRG